MEISRGPKNLKKEYKNLVVTIGNFDGVHIGHQKIFRNVTECAERIRGTAMAITFNPHPLKVIAPERGVRMLTSLEEKLRLMEHYGIDVVLCIDFDREFAGTPPDDFIRQVIMGDVKAREVIVGHNYSFGKGKKGTTSLLRRRAKQLGFGFRVIRNARLYGHVVSSSRIRTLISRGRVCEASRLLGRPYMIEGCVVKGAGRGAALLNTPTANIASGNELIPREGVYAVKIGLGRRLLDGIANIGRNPTFGENPLSSEVHVFDFSGDLLGRAVKVYFIDRIRDERRFPGVGDLSEQIALDMKRAQDILKRNKYPTAL